MAEQPLSYVEVSLSFLSSYKDIVYDFIKEVVAHLQKNKLNDFEIWRENEWSIFLIYKK